MKVYEYGTEHEKAVIDAGITPYPYPKPVCRLIALKDWVMIMLATKSYFFMKLAAPPERFREEVIRFMKAQ